GFDGVDVGPMTPEIKRAVDSAGLEVGTSDLMTLNGLCGSDSDVEKAVQSSREVIDAAAATGVTRLFSVIIPQEPARGRAANFDSEALYLHGNLGPSFGQAKAFGEDWWRYSIPGEGIADWGKICAELDAIGYDGFISVELEDFRYHRTWEAESEGLLRARAHLA